MTVFFYTTNPVKHNKPSSEAFLSDPSVFKCVHHSNSETLKVEVSAADGDPASDGDRASRRPRRYFTPGDSRLSERFRTQPITSAERLESDR